MNAIEALNRQLRTAIKTKGHFPSEEASKKLIYLAITNAAPDKDAQLDDSPARVRDPLRRPTTRVTRQAMLARRRANGDGGLEALRVLKRRLSDVVYRALRADATTTLADQVSLVLADAARQRSKGKSLPSMRNSRLTSATQLGGCFAAHPRRLSTAWPGVVSDSPSRLRFSSVCWLSHPRLRSAMAARRR